MSGYEELVERCSNACYDTHIKLSHNEVVSLAKAVLSEVLRTLETPTPEAVSGGDEAIEWDSDDESGHYFARYYDRDAAKVWTAMLHASPLTPPL